MNKKKKAIAVVGDFKFLRKYFSTFMTCLTDEGNYKGEVLVLTSKITPTFLIRSIHKNSKVKVLRFNNIKFKKYIKKRYLNLYTSGQPNRFKTKPFQWFKLNLFDMKMQEWDRILYLDINLTIHHDINNFLNIDPLNMFFAKGDGYPDYVRTLESQFDVDQPEMKLLRKRYNLDDSKYFQTGLMYFDTSIIKTNTLSQLIDLAHKYPICITNEQGILNLFFQDNKSLYSEVPEYIDDYMIYYYWKLADQNIIITKQLVEQYK